jgi:hypothetical protein
MVLVDRVGVGVGGVAVYITQSFGRGTVSPTDTRNVCVGDSESKSLTLNLAAAYIREVGASNVSACPYFV